jgi:hypothetical protein
MKGYDDLIKWLIVIGLLGCVSCMSMSEDDTWNGKTFNLQFMNASEGTINKISVSGILALTDLPLDSTGIWEQFPESNNQVTVMIEAGSQNSTFVLTAEPTSSILVTLTPTSYQACFDMDCTGSTTSLCTQLSYPYCQN